MGVHYVGAASAQVTKKLQQGAHVGDGGNVARHGDVRYYGAGGLEARRFGGEIFPSAKGEDYLYRKAPVRQAAGYIGNVAGRAAFGRL
jgi:hypothetical protein